ncbi:hypothetical protein CDAR_314521 [Caerostris darwini]|uniref:Uncharacterized protein n=1 Tax=Caerostris darwini TaxID=1538125 RepID=A0AAV4TQD8_9ARAC|nr:hypothetical protein CDAR_314521 [Caerostris darwini]
MGKFVYCLSFVDVCVNLSQTQRTPEYLNSETMFYCLTKKNSQRRQHSLMLCVPVVNNGELESQSALDKSTQRQIFKVHKDTYTNLLTSEPFPLEDLLRVIPLLL